MAVLDQVMWQGSNNTKSIVFRSALTKLYSNTIGDLTWRLLLTRYKQNLAPNKVTEFNDTIQLYGT